MLKTLFPYEVTSKSKKANIKEGGLFFNRDHCCFLVCIVH